MAKKSRKKAQNGLDPAVIQHATTQPTTPANKLMLPPARPVQKVAHPNSNLNRTGVGASAKKRRRRTKKSGQGVDSFSEATSVVSADTTSNTEVSASGNQHVSAQITIDNDSSAQAIEAVSAAPAPVSQQTSIRDTLTEEQRKLYDREPELFGDYAFSSVDEDASDDDHQLAKKIDQKSSTLNKRINGQSDVKPKDSSIAVQDERGSQPSVLTQEKTSTAKRPKIPVESTRQLTSSQFKQQKTQKSDQRSTIRPNIEIHIPEPPQLPNGRFACPFSESHHCEKNYAYVSDARNHAMQHVDPNKFRCHICGKNLSRKDKLSKHVKTHDEPKETEPEKMSEAHLEDPQASGTTNNAHTAGYDAMDFDIEVTDAEPEPSTDEDDDPYEANDQSRLQLLGSLAPAAEDHPTNMNMRVELPTAAPIERDIVAPATKDRKRKRASPESSNLRAAASKSRKRARKEDDVLSHSANLPVTLQADHDSSPVNDNLINHEMDGTEAGVHLAKQVHENVTRGGSESSAAGKHLERADDLQGSLATASAGASGESPRRTQVRKQSIPVRSRPEPQMQKRQSSLDDFVERPGSEAPQTRLLPVSKRIIVNTLPRSTTGHKPASRKTDTSAKVRQKPPRSIKGKEKAVISDEDESDAEFNKESHSEEEASSSDDRPKATTVAHRTSYFSSKEKLKVSSKRKSSDSEDDSDSDSNSSAFRARRKTRPPNREATFKELAKMGEIGRFTDDEVQVLDDWRDSFCAEHNISHWQFNDMMTASLRRGVPWKAEISKKDFMQLYYAQLPNRNRRAMLRFRERHFQNLEDQKWSEEHDKELKDLVQQLGPKWVEIGEMMGRSQDFLFQRWNHRLNKGNKRELGTWTAAEEKELFREVQAFAKTKGKSPTSKSLHIPWAAISQRLGTHRTAQQCSNKWRNETTKRVGDAYVSVPLSDRMPSSGVRAPRTPSKMAKRLAGSSKTPTSRTSSTKTFKSAERVENSDEADNEHDEDDLAEKPFSDSDQHRRSEEKEDVSDASDHGERAASQLSGDDSSVSAADSAPSSVVDETEATSEANGDDPDADAADSEREPDVIGVRKYVPSPSPPARQKLSSQNTLRAGKFQQSSPLKPPISSQNSTPRKSKNPFRNEGALNDKPSLSQAFAGTQANSSAKRSSSSRSVQDSSMPDRPSPKNSVRRDPLRSPVALTSSLRSRGEDNDYMDFDDVKSPDSFVSAQEAGAKGEKEETSSTESAHDSDQDESDVDDNSSPDAEPDTNIRHGERATLDKRPQNGGFWGSIRNYIPFSQPTATQKSTGQGSRDKGRGALHNILKGHAKGVHSDDDDDDDER